MICCLMLSGCGVDCANWVALNFLRESRKSQRLYFTDRDSSASVLMEYADSSPCTVVSSRTMVDIVIFPPVGWLCRLVFNFEQMATS